MRTGRIRVRPASSAASNALAPCCRSSRAKDTKRIELAEATPIDMKDAPVIVKTPSYPLALVPPPRHAIANGRWETQLDDERTIAHFIDSDGKLAGFGVAPHEAKTRQALLAALGSSI